jgi:hypothetical protein
MHRSWAGRGGTVVLFLGLTACGKDPTSPLVPSPTPNAAVPATLADLSAGVTSPETGRDLNCREDVHAQVVLMNRAARFVTVTGVVQMNSVIAGGCTIPAEFTFTRHTDVFTNTTGVVLDQALFNNGSGCCPDPNKCSGGTCEFRAAFRVQTEVGDVPAGGFNYKVTFNGCVTCTSTTSTLGSRCAPAAR